MTGNELQPMRLIDFCRHKSAQGVTYIAVVETEDSEVI